MACWNGPVFSKLLKLLPSHWLDSSMHTRWLHVEMGSGLRSDEQGRCAARLHVWSRAKTWGNVPGGERQCGWEGTALRERSATSWEELVLVLSWAWLQAHYPQRVNAQHLYLNCVICTHTILCIVATWQACAPGDTRARFTRYSSSSKLSLPRLPSMTKAKQLHSWLQVSLIVSASSRYQHLLHLTRAPVLPPARVWQRGSDVHEKSVSQASFPLGNCATPLPRTSYRKANGMNNLRVGLLCMKSRSMRFQTTSFFIR